MKCPYCNYDKFTDTYALEKHKPHCAMNPDAKLCPTCDHYIILKVYPFSKCAVGSAYLDDPWKCRQWEIRIGEQKYAE